MATHIITRDQFLTTFANAAHDDTIRITDTGDVIVGNGFSWDKGVRIEHVDTPTLDANPLGAPTGQNGTFLAKFTPLVRFVGLGQLGRVPIGETLEFVGGFEFGYDNALWPNYLVDGRTWSHVGADLNIVPGAIFHFDSANCYGDVIFNQCKFRGGYGPTGINFTGEKLPDFDSTLEYWDYSVDDEDPSYDPLKAGLKTATVIAEFDKPMPDGHDDEFPRNMRNGFMYNTAGGSPHGIGGDTRGNVIIRNCCFEDLNYGITLTMFPGEIKALLANNWYERTIRDNEQVGWHGLTVYSGPTQGCLTRGHVHIDIGLSSGKDLGNPHMDGGQYHANPPVAPRGLEIRNSILWSRDPRHPTQFRWVSDAASFYGVVASGLLAIGANKCFEIENSRDAYARNCVGFTPTYYDNPDYGVSASIAADTLSGNQSAGALFGCVGETRIKGANGDTVTNNRVIAAQNAVDQAATFVGDWTVEPTGIWDAFEKARLVNSSNGRGLKKANGANFANVREFLDESDFSGEPIWAKVSDQLQKPASTQLVSGPAIVHGGDRGDIHMVEMIDTGVEWRSLDIDDAGMTITAFSSAPGSVAVGKRIELRATTPASGIGQFRYSVGGTEFTWTLTTISAHVWPEATVPAGTRIGKADNGLLGMDVAPRKFSFAFRFKPLALTSGARFLSVGNGATRVQMGSPLGTPAYSSLQSTILDAAASAVASHTISRDIAKIEAGATCQFLFSYDLDEGESVGLKIVNAEGQSQTVFTAATWEPHRIPDFLDEGWSILGSVFNNNFCPGDLSYFAFWDEAIDWSDAIKQTMATIDFIGPRGQGPTADNTPAKIFIVGEAALLNNVDANFGTGGPFVKDGSAPGTITQAVVGTRPGDDLALYVAYVVGEPIVGQEFGLLVKAAGTPKAVTITPSIVGGSATLGSPTAELEEASRDGVLVPITPTAAGPLAVSWANDGGYANPADTLLTVAPAAITATRPIRITRPTFASLRL